jgi:hypothetical protein
MKTKKRTNQAASGKGGIPVVFDAGSADKFNKIGGVSFIRHSGKDYGSG